MQTTFVSNTSQDDSLPNQWINWCRLCAKEDQEHNINILYQNEEHVENENKKLSIKEALAKYFWVQCSLQDSLPKMLCTNCLSLVSSMINFNERVERVQLMYLHLAEQTSTIDGIDLNSIRLKYDVTETERNLWFSKYPLNDAINHELHLKENSLSENESKIQIKQETGDKILEMKYDNYIEEDSDLEKEEITFDDSNNDTPAEIEEDPFENHDKEPKSSHYFNNEEDTQDSMSNKTIKSEPDIQNSQLDRNVRKKKRKKLKQFSSLESKMKRNSLKDIKLESTCKECGEHFNKYTAYREHLQMQHHQNITQKYWPCPACDKVLLSIFNLQRHVRIHVPLEARKTIKCSECDNRYTSNAQLETHVRHKHKNEKPFICEECGLCLRTNSNLRQHMLIHTDLAPFECEVCKKKFKNKTRLKTHMDIHSPNKHICNICGLQLNSRATLNRHFLVHSDEMQHKCDYCGKAFKRAKALKNHLLLHTGLKPYSCDFCDRTFANGSNCRSHMKKMHPEELAILEASGNKTHTKNIPKLETLKAVTKAADNLTPVVTKFSGCFAFGKKPKNLDTNNSKTLQTFKNSTKFQKVKKPALQTANENDKFNLASPSSTPLDLQFIPLAGNSNTTTPNCLAHDAKSLANEMNDVSLTAAATTTTPIPNFNNIYQHIMKQNQTELQIKEISTHPLGSNITTPLPNPFYQHNNQDIMQNCMKSVTAHPVDDLLHSSEESHHSTMTPLTHDEHSSNAASSSSLQATFYGPLRNTLPPPGSFM